MFNFKEDSPRYVNNRQVHDLLSGKIRDMSRMMSTMLCKASEHGGLLLEKNLSSGASVRGMSCSLSMTVVEISDKKKTIAFDKNRFLVMDDEVLDSIETAAITLCAFKAATGRSPSFSVGDDASSLYLAQALLEEDLCDDVLVLSQEAIDYLDDDRVSIGKTGTSQFRRLACDLSGDPEFAASEQLIKQDVASVFSYLLSADDQEGWVTLGETLRNGMPDCRSVFFLCDKPMVCKTVAVRMLLDALGDEDAM